MVKITYRSREAGDQVLDIEPGHTLMEGGQFGSIPGIEGLCGGTIACGTCHVHIDKDWYERVGPPGESEAELLDALDERAKTSRLGCQVKVSDELDGLIVDVATS